MAENSDLTKGVVARIERDKLIKSGVTLRLRPLESLTVTVRDVHARPLKGAELSLYSYYDYRMGQTTDSKGRIVFKKLYPGDKYRGFAELAEYGGRGYIETPRVGSREWTGRAEMVVRKQ